MVIRFNCDPLVCGDVFLNGCVSEKQRAKICATCQHTDSVSIVSKDTIVYKDTTIYLSIQGDSIIVPCPETKPFDIVKKRNGIITELKGNGKTVECICSDDSLKLVLAKVRADHFKEVDKTTDEKFLIQCDRKHVDGWYNFCNWYTIITVCLLIGAIFAFGFKFFRKK